MKKLSDIYKLYLDNNLSVIGSKALNGKYPFSVNMMCDLAINENKKILLYTLESPTLWFLEQIISCISGIDRISVKTYLNPCGPMYKKNLNFDRDKYINTLELLQNHNLTIVDLGDKLIDNFYDLIIQNYEMDNTFDMIIIDNLEKLDDIPNALKILKELSVRLNVSIVLLTNLKRHTKNISIKDFDKNIVKYADFITALYDENFYNNKISKKHILHYFIINENQHYKIPFSKDNMKIYDIINMR